jgi:hypothetical protein
VAGALSFLHARSPPLLHRDVKSANVLLDEGDAAKITDFGTVFEAQAETASQRGGEGERHHTAVGRPMGTRGYMAPEYARTNRVSEKTDSYAFGVILLELLTGLPPQAAIDLHAAADPSSEQAFFNLKLKERADPRAGGWPAAAVSALGPGAAQRCLRQGVAQRATVDEVRPALERAVADCDCVPPVVSPGGSGGGGGLFSRKGKGGKGGTGGKGKAAERAEASAERAYRLAAGAFTAQAAAAAQLSALRACPSFGPCFDMTSGEPTNADARRMCVLQWRAGEAESVRALPFVVALKATDGFSDLCVVGGGGSCLVYQVGTYDTTRITLDLPAAPASCTR